MNNLNLKDLTQKEKECLLFICSLKEKNLYSDYTSRVYSKYIDEFTLYKELNGTISELFMTKTQEKFKRDYRYNLDYKERKRAKRTKREKLKGKSIKFVRR